MARSREFWNSLWQAFNPSEVLVGQRSHDLYCERSHEPFKGLLNKFAFSAPSVRPPITFFTGHRGSGKSSLLFRLLERFRDDYFVVYFDIEHNLDSGKANHLDLLYLLGISIFQVAVREGVNPDPRHLQALAESIYSITHETKEKVKDQSLNIVELTKDVLCFGASMFGAALGEKLAQAVLNPFSMTSGVSEEVARKRETEPRVQEIITHVNLIITDVQTKVKKNLLVIVDGLDKLPQLEQAELIFFDSRALSGPLCRIIYTVPMLIFSDPRFAQVEEEGGAYFLSNVKLYDREDDSLRDEEGYAFLREVVRKRLHSVPLAPEDVFAPEVLDLLITKSGGVMRWFIGLVQDACLMAAGMELDTVNREAAQQAIDDRVAKLTGRLTRETVAELQAVRKSKWPSNSKESGLLLHGLLIVAYRNQRTWFDAHPLVWEVL